MKYIYIIFLVFVSVCLFYGCLDDPEISNREININKPVISDFVTSDTTANSVRVTAKISRHNGSKATIQGYTYYEENDNKKIEEIKVIGKTAENGVVTFDTIIGNLKAGKKYIISAFAENIKGKTETEKKTIQTNTGLGSVETLKIDDTKVKGTSAKVSGRIISSGEGEVEERGIYYSLLKDFSKYDSVSITENINPYECEIVSLKTETKYYVRAYVWNTFGVFTGKIDSITTKDGKPVVSKPDVIERGYMTAKIKGSVIAEGDEEVTERGIYWSKYNTPPPIAESFNKADDKNGVGEFTIDLTGLEPETTYFAWSYAKNEKFGIKYSQESASFSTISTKPSIETVAVILEDNGTVTVRGNVLDQGLTPIIAAGFCWSTSSTPTVENDTIICSYGEGAYTGIIKTLKGGRRYYVRAYATNSNETAYGNIKEIIPDPVFTNASVQFTGGSYTPNTNAYFTIDKSAFILGGDIGTEYTDKMWEYNTKNWQGKRAFPDNKKRKWQTAIGVGDLGYVLGGIDEDNNVSDDFYSYSLGNNEWTEVSKGPGPRHSAVATYITGDGGFAFFIGGYNTGAIREVWQHNILGGWLQKPDFPIYQYGGIAVTLNGVIYAGLGSKTGGSFNKELWSSNDNCDTWTSETSFPENVSAIRGGVVFKNNIYVIDNTGTIWQYKTIEKEWAKKSNASDIGKNFHCMFVLNNEIYIGFGQFSNTLIIYNPTWDN